jgi:hypothetical protein
LKEEEYFWLCTAPSWGTQWHSGWGTTLQTGRSRVQFLIVSLEFIIDIILPAALWPWGQLSLWQKWVPGIYFLRIKAAGAWGLTTLPPSCANRLQILGASTSWNPQGL